MHYTKTNSIEQVALQRGQDDDRDLMEHLRRGAADGWELLTVTTVARERKDNIELIHTLFWRKD